MSAMQKILVVDDTELNIEILLELLSEKYDILVATDGKSAIEIANIEELDMILLDIMMPEMDGFEVCKQLKENSKTVNIPVIFITAKTDDDSLTHAYDVGGIDYIVKPFRAKEVLSRVSTHLAISGQSQLLEKMVLEKTKELHDLTKEIEDTQKEVVFTMGAIGETRSKETGNHVKRVAEYSKILALAYGIGEEEAELLKMASPMHDIGKVGIPDDILHKPAKLTAQEFDIMKTHSKIGYEMFKHSSRDILKTAAIVAHEHHEKWDGSGYPQGIKGEDIHIYGRITAVADVFDALGSTRAYKEAWDDEKIFKLFQEEKGKQFDPSLIDLFFENFSKLDVIRKQNGDEI